jgi:hypothetical protein
MATFEYPNPTLVRHRIFGPFPRAFGFQPVSLDTPFPSGPRQRGQSNSSALGKAVFPHPTRGGRPSPDLPQDVRNAETAGKTVRIAIRKTIV